MVVKLIKLVDGSHKELVGKPNRTYAKLWATKVAASSKNKQHSRSFLALYYKLQTFRQEPEYKKGKERTACDRGSTNTPVLHLRH